MNLHRLDLVSLSLFTPALYVIGCLSLVCATILPFGLPARLRAREEQHRD